MATQPVVKSFLSGRAGRLLRWAGGGVLAILLLVCLAVGGLATSAGTRWALSLADLPSRGIATTSVEGALLGTLEVRGLRVTDPDGVWLTADRLLLAWQPWALFSGRLNIEALHAEAIRVDRLPTDQADPVAEPQVSGGFDPRLLGHLRIGSLMIDGLHIGGAVLGAPFDLDVNGQAETTPRGGLKANLTANWEDTPGEVRLDATFEPDDTLALHLSVFEPRGGVLATRMGIPDAPPLRLSLDGDGPVADWQGAFLAEVEGLALLQSDLSLTVGDVLTSALDGRLTIGPDAPPEAAMIIGEGVPFTARFSQKGPVFAVEGLEVHGPAWRMVGTGQLGEAEALQADLTLTLQDGNPVAALSEVPLGSGTVQVRASGTVGKPRVDVDLHVLETLVRDVTATLRADIAGRDILLSGSGRLAGITDEAPELAPLIGEGIGWTLAGGYAGATDIVTVTDVTVTAQSMAASATAEIGLVPLTIFGRGTIDVPDLSVFAPLAGLSLGGVGHINAAFEQVGDRSATGTLAMAFDDFALGIPAADGMIGGSLSARTGLTMDGPLVTLKDLVVVAGGGAMLEGTVGLAGNEALSGAVTLTIPTLEPMAVGLSGEVSAGATLAGTLAAPHIALDIGSKELLAAGVPIQNLAVTADITTAVARVTSVTGLAAGAMINGAATMDFGSGLIDGRLTADLPRGSALNGVAMVDVTGGATAIVTLAPRGGLQGGDATLEIAGINIADADVAVSALTASAVLNDLFGAPSASLTIQAEDGSASPVAWSTLTLAATAPDLTKIQADLSVRGEGDSYALTSRFAATDKGAVEIASLDLTGQGHRLALESPASVVLGQRVLFSVPKMTVDDGTLLLSGEMDSGTIDLTLSGRALPLAILELVEPETTVTGRLDADVTVSGAFPRPSGSMRLSATDVAIPAAEVAGLEAIADISLAQGRASVQARLSGLSPKPAVLQATVPLLMPAGGFEMPGDQPLEGALDWDGPVDRLWALVPQVGHRLTGDALLEGRLGGTPDDLQVSLMARIDSGRYENLQWGTVLDQLTASASLAENGTVSVEAKATDGGKGRVAVIGSLEADDLQDVPDLAAEITLTQATLIRRDDLTATLEGQVSYTGSTDAGVLAGNLRTQRVEVQIGDTFGGGVPELNIIEVNADLLDRPNRTGVTATRFGDAVDVSIGIDLPGQVFIRGDGLDSEWRGDLHVGGRLSAVRLYGYVAVLRGGYDFLGKRFSLINSRIAFQGAERVTPLLDVKAVNEQANLTATIQVTGTPDDPEINLESTPALPRDEILARVLFGQSLAQLGPGQALAVAQAAAKLTGIGGGGGGLDFTGAIRSSLGLDVLSIGGDASGPSVAAGKYIDDKIYVGVEQGVGEGSGRVSVEVELTPRVSVETRASSGAGADIGINWKFDY